MSVISISDLSPGLLLDASGAKLPVQVYGFCAADPLEICLAGTLYGVVWTGEAKIEVEGSTNLVRTGEYFSLPVRERATISGGAIGFAVLRVGYRGLRTIGGPVEPKGRLRYIDGCSDTLLIGPPRLGDPCFNLLHFPSGIVQTKHIHPSIRVGLVHVGEGVCEWEGGSQKLSAGRLFIIPPNVAHAFGTVETAGMTLTVFHPDSDFGPTDEDHPMLNRTYVDGVSARHLDLIRTKHLD
jgi:quercetin dioxygenase-like cupin family protein